MRTCTWVVTAVAAAWFVSPAPSAEPKTPTEKGLEIRSPLPGTAVVRSIVKDGAKVKKGDLLITFDDSSLRNDLERLRIEVATAIARATAAKTGLQRAEAESKKVDIAELALKVAGLRCHSHSAELEMELKMVEREIAVAEKSLELLKRRIEDVVANADGDSLEAAIAEFELFKAKAELEAATDKKGLLDTMRPLREAELQLAMKQAELEFIMVKGTTAEELKLAQASLAATEQALQVKQARLNRIEELLKQANVLAPSDGTVQYAVNGMIAEGIVVRERQPLLILIAE